MQVKDQRLSVEDEEVGFEVFGRGRDTILSREIREKWERIRADLIYRHIRSSMDREVSRSYRDCSKIVFSKKRKTQTWMQSNMLLNQRSKKHFKPLKTSLNKKNVKLIDPKNTHTLNKSNQFYISKTSQNSLVSIH